MYYIYDGDMNIYCNLISKYTTFLNSIFIIE